MPFLIPFVVLAYAKQDSPIPAMPITPATAPRDLTDVMISELEDPKVQIKIGVTSTQRQLQSLRLGEMALKLGFEMMKGAVSQSDDENDKSGMAAFSSVFSGSSAKALYPFLAENQISKLRRRTIKDYPLQALMTKELAFTLELTAKQKSQIDALYVKATKDAVNPNRPSIKAMQAAFKEMATEAAKFSDADSDTVTPERIDKMQPIMFKLFRNIERATVLAAKEKYLSGPDPLKLLTVQQRRRFKELSGA